MPSSSTPDVLGLCCHSSVGPSRHNAAVGAGIALFLDVGIPLVGVEAGVTRGLVALKHGLSHVTPSSEDGGCARPPGTPCAHGHVSL